MKFLCIVKTDPKRVQPTPEELKKLGEYSQASIKAGVVLLTGGVVRPSAGIKVEQAGGKVSFTDGPYAESKELIDGYAILEAKDLEECKRHVTEFMVIAKCGTAEILPMFDYGGETPPKAH
jgi:hypothetical protein